MRSVFPPSVRRLVPIAVGLVSALGGVLLLSDQPGLRLDYHALPLEVSTEPVFSAVAMPRIESKSEVTDVLVSPEIFELRWTGWLWVEKESVFEFELAADEMAFAEVDGVRVVETGRQDRKSRSEPIDLAAGLHPLRIGLTQTGGTARLAVRWGAVGGELRSLAADSLVSRSPAGLRMTMRRVLGGSVGNGATAALGVGLLGAGSLFFLGGLWPWIRRSRSPATNETLVGLARRPLGRAVVWSLLWVVTFLVVLPFTASTTDGDDIRYMDGARFNKQMGWNMNRYAHIYALKVFIWLEDGDAFAASRVYWAFLFATTVVALAVGAGALGSGLQLGATGLALFLLFAQPDLFGGIGAAYADYSAMMFVALGVAVYLHGSFRRSDEAKLWPALLLGALSVAAAKSKEPGLILLWLVPGMLWSGGRIEWRRFRQRLLWWLGGAVLAYLLLMTLDAFVLGDFWFSLRGESLAGARRLKDAAEGIWQLSRWAWLDVAWENRPRQVLSVLALTAAMLSLLRPARAELRWVAWMPIAFMGMMIAIHPAISSPRYLFPIVPVACFAVPMVLWNPLSARPTPGTGRILWAFVLVVLLFALNRGGFNETVSGLRSHRTAQSGDWILYPWHVFRQQLEEARPRQITISDRLYRSYHMIGKSRTRDRIARLFFQRRFLRLRRQRGPSEPVGWSIVTRAEYRRWLEARPELAERASFDPSGRIVLLSAD